MGEKIQPVRLERTSQTFEPGDTNQIGLADLDSDGDLDVFIAFYGDGSNSVWLNK
jgi:hypothetical protein